MRLITALAFSLSASIGADCNPCKNLEGKNELAQILIRTKNLKLREGYIALRVEMTVGVCLALNMVTNDLISSFSAGSQVKTLNL